MSSAIMVMGPSGSGKTASLRTLAPESTYCVDADCKGLPWKGWREQYNADRKNYLATADAGTINAVMEGVSKKRPEIKALVVDTINAIMYKDEIRRMGEKSYDRWIDLAMSVFGLIEASKALRDDLTVIFIGHTQTQCEDSGYMFTRLKTSGKKLDKICLEGMFNTVLLSKASGGGYLFETRAANSTAKTPMGAFDEAEIPNDMAAVLKALEEY
jgi:hypothetical protein